MNSDMQGRLMIDDTMAHDADCEESRLLLSRRSFLGLTAGLFTTAYRTRVASAAGASDPRLLIVLLRGGWDGLNILPDFGDEQKYHDKRGDLALVKSDQLPLFAEDDSSSQATDYSHYRLNQYMPQLQSLFLDGQARIVLPIAPPLRTRSHFDCSFNLENGSPGNAKTDAGWLNKLLQTLPTGEGLLVNRSPLQIGNTPVILTGAAATLTWTPNRFANDFFSRNSAVDTARLMERLYTGDVPLQRAMRRGTKVNNLATGAGFTANKDSALLQSIRGAANLLASPEGPRVAVLTVNGFDSHSKEKELTKTLYNQFDQAMGEFRKAMGGKSSAAWRETLVVCVSEFGRSVTSNGSLGSDHGTGTVALILGGALNGSKIIGTWPVLDSRTQILDNNDVAADYDTRDLFKAVLTHHLGITDVRLTRGPYANQRLLTDVVFPGSATPLPGPEPLADLFS